VVFNARAYTVDPIAPQAEAFAVKAGRFVAVGSSEEVQSLIGPRTQTLDARQMTIVPGFIDAHNHAPGAILLYEVLVGNPYDVEFVTIANIVDKLRARARETPAGFWIEGFFFDDTKVKDQRPLNIHDLDQVSREHPVSVRHRGGHTTYYNSKAFELAGITSDTPNSAAGTYDRDSSGALNGRVTDRARGVFEKVGKRPSYGADQRLQRNRDAMSFISKQFVRYGLTSVHHEGGDLAALQQVRARGDLLHRVSYEAIDDVLEAMIKNGIATGFGTLAMARSLNARWHSASRTQAWSRPTEATSRPPKRTSTPGSSGCTGPISRSIATPMATWPSTWCSRHSSGRSACSLARILVQRSRTAR